LLFCPPTPKLTTFASLSRGALHSLERREMEISQPYGISAAPNACKVKGELLSRKKGPDGHSEIWKVKVEATENVEELPNFAKSRVGEVITVVIPPDTKHKLAEGDRLNAKLAFEGSEHGGEFFLQGGQVRKL
jgi:hypothetical protein